MINNINCHSAISKLLLILFFFLTTFGSCKKMVEVDPPITQTTGASVYQLDATAAAVFTGLYTNLSKGSFATGITSISVFSGLSADEFRLSNTVSNTDKLYFYYTNSLFTNLAGSPGTENWESFYRYIYICNAALEGLTKSTSLTPSVVQQLKGEAKFMRAFLYFYLMNLYGEVPLAVSSDYEINSILHRSSVVDVYQQIITDLLEAKNLLADHYIAADALTNTNERLRPTKWAATALLARAYLYYGNLTGDVSNYTNAETQATTVISASSHYNLVPLNNVFLANSMEAIWQLQPVNLGWNTEDARAFIINAAPSTTKPIFLSQSLLNSFELNDARKINWVKDTTIASTLMPYPYKYKKAKLNDPVSEYLMVLRLGEQYLVRAEAKAQLGNISGAQTDLNVIRNRAGLLNTSANDKNSLLSAILQERKIELSSEWGHRWFDLKRTGQIEAVMTTACTQKGGVWQNYQQLYPILYTEIERNRNLTQNFGY